MENRGVDKEEIHTNLNRGRALPFEEKKEKKEEKKMGKHRVEFNAENHTYKVDGVDAISVTQLLKAVGIDKGFDEDDKVLMAKVKAASEKRKLL